MDDEKLESEVTRLINDLELDNNEKNIKKVSGLLEDAIIIVLDFCNRDDNQMVGPLYQYARKLAVISYNSEGSEGETSRSEGGVSQSFSDDIPLSIKNSLKRYRLGKVVSWYATEK